MLFLIIKSAVLLYLTEEIKGMSVNVEGFIEVEPSWLLDDAKTIARAFDMTVSNATLTTVSVDPKTNQDDDENELNKLFNRVVGKTTAKLFNRAVGEKTTKLFNTVGGEITTKLFNRVVGEKTTKLFNTVGGETTTKLFNKVGGETTTKLFNKVGGETTAKLFNRVGREKTSGIKKDGEGPVDFRSEIKHNAKKVSRHKKHRSRHSKAKYITRVKKTHFDDSDETVEVKDKTHLSANKKVKDKTHSNASKTVKVKDKRVKHKIKSMDQYFDNIARSGRDNNGMENSALANKSQLVQDDNAIKDFVSDVFNRSLQALSSVQKQLNGTGMSNRVMEMRDSYKEKFGDFINETLQQKIKTSIGREKVVLNIIEVSNRMLKTIVSDLKTEIRKQKNKGHSREYEDVSDSGLDKIIEKQANKQYIHACQSLGICHSDYGYAQFLASIVTEVLKADDDKVKEANDALTEALKYSNLRDIIDDKNKLLEKIKYLETLNSKDLRVTYQNFRNMLASENKIVTVYVADKKILKKSLAMRELIDLLENSILPTTENKQTWKQLSLMTEKWYLGEKDTIQEVMKLIVKQLLQEGFYPMATQRINKVRENVAVLLE